MSRKAALTVLITLFLLITFFMQLYPFARLLDSFGIEKGIWFGIGLLALTGLFPLANVVERTTHGKLGKALYRLAATWLGCAFIFFTVTLATEPLRLLIDDTSTGIIVAGTSIILIGYSLWNARQTRITELEIQINGLHKDMTVVHLSDLHLGAINNREYAEKLVDSVNDIGPDAVFLTGDIADDSGDFTHSTVEPFDNINAPIFCVTGNHENYLGLKQAISIIKKTKIRMLRNEMVLHEGVHIAGFDYPIEGFSTVENDIRKLRLGKEPAILLFHAPQYLDAARRTGFDAMFCGHVHGGQIVPFNLLVRLFFPYTRGLHEYRGMKVVVSMGTSTWGPPMRLGTSNEIIVARLKKS